MIAEHIFRAYDIRGIAMGEGADLNNETANLIGKAAGTFLLRRGAKSMAVGRDGRLTSPELQKALIEGLLSTGLNVTNIGLTVSPMLYFATCIDRFDCGINVTASHNPKEYNGFKIVEKNAHSVCGDELQEILQLIKRQDFLTGSGDYTEFDVWPLYKAELLKRVSLKSQPKVVVDAGNGVAGAFVEDLFMAAGAQAKCLFVEVDGNFPNHEANPEVEENLKTLAETVIFDKAMLGIAFDGDGDRVGIVDQNGKFYSADLLLLQLARDVLSRNHGAKIVFDVKCSRVLENDIKAKGGVALRSATGHSFIENRMKEEGALLGGEISGHLFFAENYFGFDDAFLAALKLLELASRNEGGFAELFNDVPTLLNTPEIKMPCPDKRKFEILDQVKKEFVDRGYDVLTIDGAFVSLNESTWGAVRCSNTSPNLTLRFEADTEENLEKIKNLFKEVLAGYSELNVALI